MRDARGRTQPPKPIGETLGSFRTEIAPETVLAAVQGVWDGVVGDRIAAVTDVVEERENTITVECSNPVWADELELMAPRIMTRLREELGDRSPEKLRFRSSR